MNLTLPAPAKINLFLRVGAILADGRHELETAFAFAEAHDILRFSDSDALLVSCSRPHLDGENNLVQRLLTAFRELHAVKQGLAVHVDKQLPEQAGLGGGSSDAATALLAANHLWGVHAPLDELIAFAAPFGADIPCFLYGRASLAGGIGEKLSDYPEPLPDRTMLLAWPGVGLSTAAVFKHFDAQAHSLTASGGVDTIRRGSPSLGENDLEASASSLSPAVERLLAALRRQTDAAWMSGSGSACIALFGERQQAETAAEELQRQGLATWTHAGKMVTVHPAHNEIGT